MQETVLERGKPNVKARILVITMVAITSAVAGGCGSEEGDSSPAQATGDATTQTEGGTTATETSNRGDKQEIRQTLEGMKADFTDGDGDGYCESLTAAGQKLVADIAKAYGFGTRCADYIARAAKMELVAKDKSKATTLRSVRVRGNRGIATVTNTGHSARPIVFVKVNGEWKVPDPGFRNALSPSGEQPRAMITGR